jgi:uncharacterized protein YndB with AHSA1/START domain
MPIKKDEAGKRWVEMEFLVPGTPEQVWQALATGGGLAAWFVRGEIEPRVGGVFRLDFGQAGVTSGEVTAWEPPHQFNYVERSWLPNAPPIATEITITSRTGDRCVVRMVHSLFTSQDDWDDQLEGVEQGWLGFFAILRVYLTHFAGANAASFIAMTSASADPHSAWLRLGQELGLVGANVGERRTTSAGPEPWSGIVELVHQDAQQQYVLLRVDSPSPGIALLGTTADPNLGGSDGTNVSLCRYIYGDDCVVRAVESEANWRAWLASTFNTEEASTA